MGAFLFSYGTRVEISALHPHFARSMEVGHCMDASRMLPEDQAQCPWIGWGMSKGVSHPERDLSILAHADTLPRGLHAELVAEFADEVDPYPLCYDEHHHQKGFGGFVRWIAFTNPQNPQGPGVLGIDWSLACRPTSGVATSIKRASEITQTLLRHGVHPQSEIALLNWRMCEDVDVRKWLHDKGWVTLEAWVRRIPHALAPTGNHCPRCGMETFQQKHRFCYRCGASFFPPQPTGGRRGVETRLA